MTTMNYNQIIVLGIPDKKIVYTQTTSFFKVLYDNGVKIYKYKKGFFIRKYFYQIIKETL